MIAIIGAALITVLMFCYSMMRYHEGVIEGLRIAEGICRKHHGRPQA